MMLNKGVFLVLIAFLLVLPAAYSLGVASDYIENNTLFLVQGGSSIYGIRLQNTDDQDAYVKLGIDSKIARIVDPLDVYRLPSRTTDTKVFFNITAPKNANVGEIYSVGYSLNPAPDPQTGSVGFNANIGKQFNVLIVKNPNKFYLEKKHIVIGIAVLIALIVLYFLKKRKKRKNNRKKKKTKLRSKKSES